MEEPELGTHFGSAAIRVLLVLSLQSGVRGSQAELRVQTSQETEVTY